MRLLKIGAVSVALLLGLRATAQEAPAMELGTAYRGGRMDAPYGTYVGVVAESARPLQDRINDLESRVMSFTPSSLIESGERSLKTVSEAGELYLLEHYALRLILEAQDLPGPRLEGARELLTTQAFRIYESLRIRSEPYFEDMVRFIDEVFPGPNGMQWRHYDQKNRRFVHLPNFRRDDRLAKKQAFQLYQEKLAEYEAASGPVQNQLVVLDKKSVAKMAQVERVEYVQRTDKSIIMTTGNAGHILLAQGLPVLAAGQMVFIKSNKDKLAGIIISNASGSFKPDMSAVDTMATELARQFRLPLSRVILTKGEPIGTQTMKIYLKGLKVPSPLAREMLGEFENQAQKILSGKIEPRFVSRGAQRCQRLFQVAP